MREAITITAEISFDANADFDAQHQETIADAWLDLMCSQDIDSDMEFVSYKITRHQSEAEIYSGVMPETKKVFGYATDSDNGLEVETFNSEDKRDDSLIGWINGYVDEHFQAQGMKPANTLEDAKSIWEKITDQGGTIDSYTMFEHEIDA